MSDKTSEKQPEQVHVVQTNTGDVKITQPKGTKHKGITVLLESDEVLRGQVGGFTNFLREYAVVGLAVGFVVGQQANAVAKQLVTSFVDPLVKVWFGQDLSSRTLIVHHHNAPVQIPWGAFVYTLFEFFVVVAAIYLIIKLFRLDKLKKPKS